MSVSMSASMSVAMSDRDVAVDPVAHDVGDRGGVVLGQQAGALELGARWRRLGLSLMPGQQLNAPKRETSPP